MAAPAERGTIASEPGTQLESTRRLTRQVPAAASRDKPGDVAHKRHANGPMRLPAHRSGAYSPMVSNEALPPEAVVLMVSVRSPAKRSR